MNGKNEYNFAKKTMDKKDINLSPHLFWDVDIETFDLDKYPAFVIKRVLEYGKWEDWTQIRNHYSLQTIKNAVMNLRTLEPKALNYIALYTDTDKKDYRCYKFALSNPTLWNS